MIIEAQQKTHKTLTSSFNQREEDTQALWERMLKELQRLSDNKLTIDMKKRELVAKETISLMLITPKTSLGNCCSETTNEKCKNLRSLKSNSFD